MNNNHLRQIVDELIDPFILVLFIVFSSGSFLTLIGPEGNLFPGGINFVWLMFYVFFLIFLSLELKAISNLLRKELVVFALIFLIFLSSFWSLDFFMSIKRSIALIFTTLYAVYCSTKYSSDQILRYISVSSIAILLFSIVFVFLLPELGKHNGGVFDGLWRGIFHQKNILGKTTAFSIVVWVYFYNKKRNFGYILLIICAIFVLIMSGSKTSLVAVILSFSGAYLIQRIRVKKNVLSFNSVFFFFLTILLVFILINNTESIFLALGKNETLTGRTILWVYVIQAILLKPLLGYGYGAFWGIKDNDSLTSIISNAGWEMTHAHNGLLQVALDIGMLGVAIILIFLIKAFFRFRVLAGKEKWLSTFPFLFFIFFLLMNLTQSNLAERNSIMWFTIIFFYFNAKQIPKEKTIPNLLNNKA